MIKKYGQAAICRVPGKLIPDPNKPWEMIQGPDVDHNVIVCFLPMHRVDYETYKYMTGSEVPTGSIKAIMGRVDFDPDLTNVILRNGQQLRIKSIDVLSPNGEKILYTMVLAA